jgi:hypothetical protein
VYKVFDILTQGCVLISFIVVNAGNPEFNVRQPSLDISVENRASHCQLFLNVTCIEF